MSLTTLEQIADVALGYKSLQNDFFYINQATIDTYGIEPRFVQPIYMLRDLDSQAYLQTPAHEFWLFLCREREADLRGTGALRYIHAMSERPAAQKKQAGRGQSIREALQAQSGGLWYAPKAKPHAARVWLRKAFDTAYAPFLFKEPRVVDQRCNYLEPKEGLSWELLGAVLTTTIFSYAVEVNGSASMGAGALEAPTTKLRTYPVFDPRALNAAGRRELVRLAYGVWGAERPINWSASDVVPGTHLRALDAWVLKRAGAGVSLEQLYADLRETYRARIHLARDKVRTKKKHKTENVGMVAKGIADKILRLLNARQFPENFTEARAASTRLSFPRERLRKMTLAPLLDKAELSMLGVGGKVLHSGTYDRAKAEVIVRAMLLGRESFLLPDSRQQCEAAVASFLNWFDDLQNQLESEIQESALGTGYEDELRLQVFTRLGIHPQAGDKTLPQELMLSPPTNLPGA